MEERDHGPLVGCPSILESKGQDSIAEGTPWCSERCLFPIFFINQNFVVSQESIHEGEQFMARDVVECRCVARGNRLWDWPDLGLGSPTLTRPSFLGTGTTLESQIG